jgi:chromosome segregation ATPase
MMTEQERIQALKESVKKYKTFGAQTVEFLLSIIEQRDKTIAEKDAELKTAQDECLHWWEQSEKMDAEIKRLRGALQQIRNRLPQYPKYIGDLIDFEIVVDVDMIAASALGDDSQ